jgi:hypothetical protein
MRAKFLTLFLLLTGSAVAQTAVPDMPERQRVVLNKMAEAVALSTACGRYKIEQDVMIGMAILSDLDMSKPTIYRDWVDARKREILSRFGPGDEDFACAVLLDHYGPDGRSHRGLIRVR